MANITRAEAGVLAEAVRRRVGFLVPRRQRIERTGRTSHSALRLVRSAEDALQSLWAHLHHRSSWINRPEEKDSGDSPAGL